ncbi:MAG: GNAT family N-acetyltransferase, partial [Gammaproteobacteria bacterium]|nr:GNAT family N-acetyltransferase [Gammaproteobacteria bacterium]
IATDEPVMEDIHGLRGQLMRYNQQQIGEHKLQNLGVFARDEHNRFLAGVYGWLQFGWLYIDLMWVDESLRKNGVGTHLMQELESLATDKGVSRAYLTTASFQGMEFYQKLGYEICDQMNMVSDDGQEFIRYTMRKEQLNA